MSSVCNCVTRQFNFVTVKWKMKWMKNDVSWHDISKSVKLIDLKGKWDQEVARFWSLDRQHNGEKCICVAFRQKFWCRLRSFYSVTNEGVIFQLYRFENIRFAASSQSMKRGMHCVVNKDIYRT